MALCIICDKTVDDPILLTEKGANGVNFASEQRKRDDVVAHAGSAVHMECRKRYVDKSDFPSNKRKSNDSYNNNNVNRNRSRLGIEERHKFFYFVVPQSSLRFQDILGKRPKVLRLNITSSQSQLRIAAMIVEMNGRGMSWEKSSFTAAIYLQTMLCIIDHVAAIFEQRKTFLISIPR